MADAKQGKTPSGDYCKGPTQTRLVLAKPRLGGFGSSNFGSASSKSNNPFGSVLRPPQLKPGINPFLKVTEPAEKTETEKEKKEILPEERLKDSKAGVPKFVPLGVSSTQSRSTNQVPVQPTTSSSSDGFVFGQNLSDRVVIQENVNNGDSITEAADHSSSNGTTELLFTSAAASVKDNNQDAGSGNGSDGLAAAAAEYERSHARPLPPTSNSLQLTGEEDETNVLQISCRLFAWETGSWRERGRGVLRLNDARAGGGSRLVARISGSLRVVLNTKLWPDMVVQQAGSKSLRITAADAQQQIKLYLIMGAPADIVQLNRALTARVATSKRMTTSACTQNVTSQKAAERLEAEANDSEFFEKADQDIPGDDQNDTIGVDQNVDLDDQKSNDRLEPVQKIEEYESNVDGMSHDEDTKSLKRKEPTTEETSSKRQCPEIIIE